MTKKGLLASLTSDDGQGKEPPLEAERPLMKPKFGTSAVAVGMIGQGFAIKGEGTIKDIDPLLVDPSPFNDRMAVDPASLAALVDAINAEGQRMPVLVRPHPERPGRYQLAYGHRRLKAVLAIRASVKGKEDLRLRAFEVVMSDLDLAQRQASENIDREDLSWIDQALFLSELERAGHEAQVAEKTLRLDRTVAWRMRKVMAAMPMSTIRRIGSARGIGMPRWIALAEQYELQPEAADQAALSCLDELDGGRPAEAGEGKAGEARFLAVLAAVRRALATPPPPQVLTAVALPELKLTRTSAKLSYDRDHAAFGDWLRGELPGIWKKYLSSLSD